MMDLSLTIIDIPNQPQHAPSPEQPAYLRQSLLSCKPLESLRG